MILSNVLNFYPPKSCFRILILNINHYLESQCKFQDCKSLHNKGEISAENGNLDDEN